MRPLYKEIRTMAASFPLPPYTSQVQISSAAACALFCLLLNICRFYPIEASKTSSQTDLMLLLTIRL